MRRTIVLFLLFALPYIRPALCAQSPGVAPRMAASAFANRDSARTTRSELLSVVPFATTRNGSSNHDAGRRALFGAMVGTVVAVSATALWVQHCERTSHHSEGPPCAIAFVYPGVPLIVGGAMMGALVGSRWPSGNGGSRSGEYLAPGPWRYVVTPQLLHTRDRGATCADHSSLQHC